MNEEIIKKIEALANNQEFAARAANAASAEEMLAVMAEYDFHLNEEDMKALLTHAAATVGNGELNEDALDHVSGGSWLWDLFMSWFDRQSKKNSDDIGEILDNIKNR